MNPPPWDTGGARRSGPVSQMRRLRSGGQRGVGASPGLAPPPPAPPGPVCPAARAPEKVDPQALVPRGPAHSLGAWEQRSQPGITPFQRHSRLPPPGVSGKLMSTGGGAGVPGRPVPGSIPGPLLPRSALSPALSALASLEMPARLHAAHHCLGGSTEPLRRPSLPAVHRPPLHFRQPLSRAAGPGHSWGAVLCSAGRSLLGGRPALCGASTGLYCHPASIP